jgi:signal transduction histidine kinase
MRLLTQKWRLKAVLPVAAVLLLGLALFESVMLLLETPSHHWILLIAAGGAVAICSVVLAVLAMLIQRPLADLNEKIARLRDGDLSAEVDFAGRSDEIGELGRHFNEMVVQIRHSRQEIERLHREQMTRAEHLATLGELATGLAHEIRNPLAGIAGAIEIIVRDLAPDSPRRDVLEEVRREVKRIHGILSDLLLYARPQPPQLVPADLNFTAEQAVHMAREQIRSRPIEILFSPLAGSAPVVHDPAQIEQVLLNLLLNGIQAIPEGGTIDVRLLTENGFALVSVADTGRGISPEDLPRIFRPFFTTKQRGTGLGLSLAKGIVEDHGGRIEVASAPGEGTRFSVWLPISPAGGGKVPAGKA